VGSAAICGTTTKTVRLPNGVGIFRAELYAITKALNIIYRKRKDNFIIFSDSMSSLQAVKSFRLEMDLVYQIIKDYSHLTESGKRIVVCWIPGHVNIPGNEKADSAAKSALTLPIRPTKMKIPATEYIPRVSQFCLKEWQDIWNCCDNNKLHANYPNVGRIPHYKNVPRRDALVINRLRIGHTRLTHLHLLTGEDLPTCQFCNIPLTVNHILVECPNLNTIRQRFFTVSSFKDLFDNIDHHVIIDFIKETHFYALV